MTKTRRPLTRAALGPARSLTAVERLRGGRGAYRLTLDDDSTAVAYVWPDDEDHWDQPNPDPRDVFSHGTGLGLFTTAHTDATHTYLPAHGPDGRTARHPARPHRPPLRGTIHALAAEVPAPRLQQALSLLRSAS
ncbi:hypothetical protein PV963_30070 [Streptomyces coeruleorubidus]|uniref:hypothetical protein n=1 Tax=Streptomyces coeruleorubidus TaxID=116188 RepID=UPI00237F539D|nr:hypothetical protein [Streptomyces coeruleorubidus]WDV54303.1 hypothetical protein PV963_30070 [Streptomyces coeruleorubidus]